MSTPSYSSPRAKTTDASAQINQFLGTHASSEIYEGSLVGAAFLEAYFAELSSGNYNPAIAVQIVQNPQPATANPPTTAKVINAPFQIASGTKVDRLVVPLLLDTSGAGVGASIQVSLWSTATATVDGQANVIVPNTKLAGPWTIPVEFARMISTSANTSLPGVADMFATEALIMIEDSGSVMPFMPQVPGSNLVISLGGVASDGVTMTLVGGFDVGTSGTHNNVYTWQPGNEKWQTQVSLPLALNSLAACAGGGYIITVGGLTGNATGQVANVYIANIDDGGSIGSWRSGTAYPTAVSDAAAAISGGYVFAVGGNNGSSRIANVYSASIDSSGNVGSWVAQPSYPLAASGVALVVANGYLIGIGGGATGTGTGVYAAKIGSSGALGPWRPWPSLPVAAGGLLTAWDGYGIYILGSAFDDASTIGGNVLPVGRTSGPASSWLQIYTAPAGPPGGVWGGGTALAVDQGNTAGGVPATTIYPTGSPPGGCLVVYRCAGVSIPMLATGLTAGTDYIVQIAAGGDAKNDGDPSDCFAVPVIPGNNDGDVTKCATYQLADGVNHLLYTQSAFGLTIISTVPLLPYAGTGGRLTHIVQDVSGGTSSFYDWFTYYSNGQPALVAEHNNYTGSLRQLTYDASGLLSGVT